MYRLIHIDLISLVGFRSISKTLILPRGYENLLNVPEYGLVIRFPERHGSHLGTQNFDLESNYL